MFLEHVRKRKPKAGTTWLCAIKQTIVSLQKITLTTCVRHKGLHMTDVFVCSCCGLYYLNIYQYSIHKYILYIHVHFVNRSSPNFIRDRYHADQNNQEPPRLGGKSRGSHGRPILLRPEPRTWRMHHADAVYLGDGR